MLCSRRTRGRAVVLWRLGRRLGSVELRTATNGDTGKGVRKAVESVNARFREPRRIAESQTHIDELIVLTYLPNKHRLGANAILGVSLAVAKAARRGVAAYRYVGGVYRRLLPLPMMNIINEGRTRTTRSTFKNS